MAINLQLPENIILKPCITVFGVGGAGGNAVNNMIKAELQTRFVAANTDAQQLEYSLAERRIQLGENMTRGLGAGALPEVGRASAEEAMDAIIEHLQGSNMIFVTAGMGGGTGTGAAPIIAKAARELGILTVGVVTKPFHFEGSHRMKIAEQGLMELQKYVDTLIVIPNQNLFRIANEKTTFADAFKMADEVLHAGVRSVTDLMIRPGLINLDFADIRAVMSEMGKAMMGTGEADGDKRAIRAAEAAISNPLLDHCSMKGARGVLINITGGQDMTLFEVDEAANRIRDEVDPDANIIFGSTFNPELEGVIRVSVVATGIDLGAKNSDASTPKHFGLKAQTVEDIKQEAVAKLQEEIVRNIVKPESLRQHTHEARHFSIKETIEPANAAIIRDDEPTNIQTETKIFHQPSTETSGITPKKEDLYHSSNSLYPSEDKTGERRSVKNASTLGLFGRVASSMGLRSSPAAEPRPQYTKQPEERTYGEMDDLNKDDILEIPAFLRRKK